MFPHFRLLLRRHLLQVLEYFLRQLFRSDQGRSHLEPFRASAFSRNQRNTASKFLSSCSRSSRWICFAASTRPRMCFMRFSGVVIAIISPPYLDTVESPVELGPMPEVLLSLPVLSTSLSRLTEPGLMFAASS